MASRIVNLDTGVYISVMVAPLKPCVERASTPISTSAHQVLVEVNHPDLVLEDVPRVGHAAGGTAEGLVTEETEEMEETEETEETGDGVVCARTCSTAVSLARTARASACAVRRSSSPPPPAAPAPRVP